MLRVPNFSWLFCFQGAGSTLVLATILLWFVMLLLTSLMLLLINLMLLLTSLYPSLLTASLTASGRYFISLSQYLPIDNYSCTLSSVVFCALACFFFLHARLLLFIAPSLALVLYHLFFSELPANEAKDSIVAFFYIVKRVLKKIFKINFQFMPD